MTNNHDIKKLTDYQHVRKRVNMYLGPNTPHTQYVALFSESGIDIKELTWIPAAFTAVREVIDNSLDEFIKSKITNGVLTVDYDENNLSFVISDNGRGIPTDWSTQYMANLATMVVTELKAGRNFDDSERKSVGGMNGIGVSAVCQICERMELTVTRKGTPYKDSSKSFKHKFVQLFEEGTRYLVDDLMINEPKITSTSSTKTGTSIAFTLSKEMFPVTDPAYAGKILPPELLRSLLVEIAVNHPEYDIVFNSEKIKVKNSIDKVWFNKPITFGIDVNGFKSTFYIQSTERDDMFIHSSVNNIPVFDGGTHIDGFKTQFALGMIRALEKESKRKKLKPNRTDIEAGLFVYNVTEMDAPFFSSQAKTKLTNEESTKIVSSALTDEFFEKITKSHKQWITDIFERCAERTNKKDADEATKQAKKLLKQKIAKLCDATGKRGNIIVPVQEKILFTTEGDSAAAGLNAVRDPAVHGVLPLRGKIMNVSDDSVKATTLMNSQALADIMNAIGLVPGKKVDRNELRYGNLMIATDSDHDGANITALLVNFLHTYWPDLFDPALPPFVWVFLSPYIILEKGKERRYFYGHEYDMFDPSKWSSWHVRRAKGLGTLQRVDWKHAIDNITAIPIVDDGKMKETLDLLFNKNRADDRKIWVVNSSPK